MFGHLLDIINLSFFFRLSSFCKPLGDLLFVSCFRYRCSKSVRPFAALQTCSKRLLLGLFYLFWYYCYCYLQDARAYQWCMIICMQSVASPILKNECQTWQRQRCWQQTGLLLLILLQCNKGAGNLSSCTKCSAYIFTLILKIVIQLNLER